jgi:hypothetical protein
MANSKKESLRKQICRRRSDTKNSLNLIITIASFTILLVFTYVIGTMFNRMTRMEEQQDKFLNYYLETKEQISQLSEKYKDELYKFKDEIRKLLSKRS